MKKSYETPSVEKIKFNYRDQVVAASTGGGSGTGDPVETPTQRMYGFGDTVCGIGDAIVDYLFDFASSSTCQ